MTFKPLPKYDRKIYGETIIISLDSVCHLIDDSTLEYSDRASIFKGNENPHAILKWIYYPKGDKIQLSIDICGNWHKEKICYNVKRTSEWKSKIWIRLSPNVVSEEIIKFLQRNPEFLASWM